MVSYPTFTHSQFYYYFIHSYQQNSQGRHSPRNFTSTSLEFSESRQPRFSLQDRRMALEATAKVLKWNLCQVNLVPENIRQSSENYNDISSAIINMEHLHTLKYEMDIETPYQITQQLREIDDFLKSESQSDGDIYEELIAEPVTVKKPSVAYDYGLHFPACQETLSTYQSISEETTLQQCATTHRKCTCSKSRCLKNYCQCYKMGLVCGEECGCTNCGNKDSHPKKVTTKGCRCKKSHCLKNYCECHHSGQKCGKGCECVDCGNLDQSDEMASRSSISQPIMDIENATNY